MASALLLPALLLICALAGATFMRPALLDDGLGSTAGSLVTAVTIAIALAACGGLVVWGWASDFTEQMPLSTRLLAPGVGLPVAVVLHVTLSAPLGLPRGLALVLACAATVALLVAIHRHCNRRRATRGFRLAWTQHPSEAQELIAECDEALLDGTLTRAQRSIVELQRAEALTDLSRLTDRYEPLAEAQAILDRQLNSAPPTWLVCGTRCLSPGR